MIKTLLTLLLSVVLLSGQAKQQGKGRGGHGGGGGSTPPVVTCNTGSTISMSPSVWCIGFTIGSGCFYGHGTTLQSGTATMEVDGFTVR